VLNSLVVEMCIKMQPCLWCHSLAQQHSGSRCLPLEEELARLTVVDKCIYRTLLIGISDAPMCILNEDLSSLSVNSYSGNWMAVFFDVCTMACRPKDAFLYLLVTHSRALLLISFGFSAPSAVRL